MTEQLVGEELDRLFDAVCGMDTTRGAAEPEVVRGVYGLLGAGQPVTGARLAAALGWDEDRGQDALQRLPNVEKDDRGAVVGFGGLTLRPTPHRILLDGRVGYAWCAWDSLFLPVALDARVEVLSRCPRTGRPIAVTVEPTGVVERDPDTVVVSFVRPDTVDAADLRGSFCGAVHFFAGASAAAAWTAQGPGRVVLDLGDAFALGRRMMLERCNC